LGSLSAYSQGFSIRAVPLTNSVLEIAFPGNAESYYFLHSWQSLITTSTPVSAILGSNSSQVFMAPLAYPATFFRVEQLPVTSTNSLQNDGIPDVWKLQSGLSPFLPGVAGEQATGSTATWLQIYQSQTALESLPIAYFPSSRVTVVAGASAVSIPIAFTKPYSGFLTYQLSGTATPQSSGVIGDYVQPASTKVFVANSTTATISLNLVPEPDIEINRSIVIALSAPATNGTYAITTNSCVATVQIAQSTLGVFVGTLTFTNGLLAGAQSVKLALRPGSGGGTIALLDVTGSPLLGNTFSVPVIANAAGFQLNGSQFSNVLTNTPWGRNLSVNLNFGTTQTTGAAFITPVSLNMAGLTASGLSYSGFGTLSVVRSQ
jgi:hypothetical protein